MIEIRATYPGDVQIEQIGDGNAIVNLRALTETRENMGGETEVVCELYQYTQVYDAGLAAYVAANYEALIEAQRARHTATLAAEVRARRNKLLDDTQYTAGLDYPATDAERAAWIAYRQALRDIPEQAGFPEAVEWPTPPAREKAPDTIIGAIDAIIGGGE